MRFIKEADNSAKEKKAKQKEKEEIKKNALKQAQEKCKQQKNRKIITRLNHIKWVTVFGHMTTLCVLVHTRQ